MRKLVEIFLALLPFGLTWTAPLLAAAGHEAFALRIADLLFLRVAAWCALGIGGFIALLNSFLSFGRPLILKTRNIPLDKQRNISGFPLLASFLLMFAAIPFFPRLGPCITVTVLLLLDTGGPLWYLIRTWKDDSMWTKK